MVNLPTEQHPSEVMDRIIQGAASKNTVTIRYRDGKNEISERTVEPYEIKNGKLYAYCLSKEGIRAFNTVNITAALSTGEAFEPRFPILITPPMKS